MCIRDSISVLFINFERLIFMIEFTINPDSHSKFSTKTENELSFEDGSNFKILNGTPILFGKDSIFNEEEILNQTITTQDASHLDTSSLKNYIRRKLLPSLCKDFKIEAVSYTHLDVYKRQS